MPAQLFGGIEAGGTKFVCALSDAESRSLRARASIPTLPDPGETIASCVAWFHAQQRSHGPIAAMGIGSFGPVDLKPQSPTYGFITTTPKPGWRNTNLVGAIRAAFDVPVGFDTDVNGAALGEHRWGAGQGVSNLVYITMGTGIGGGVLIGGEPLHGLVHPEIGHMRVPHDLHADPFIGMCYAHADCWEGLSSGPAIEQRVGARAESLPPGHAVWPLIAGYTGRALANLVLALSPQRIILGGSVPKAGQFGREGFMRLTRESLLDALNGYIQATEILAHPDQYVVAPGLDDDAGVCGAIVLALRAHAQGV